LYLYSATSRIPQLQRRFLRLRQSGCTAYRPQDKPAPRLWPATRQPYAPWSAVNRLHPRNPWITTQYSLTDPGGMEGWVGLVVWSIVDTLSTKWSQVNHRPGIDQGKSASQRSAS